MYDVLFTKLLKYTSGAIECVGDDADTINVIKHSFQPRIGKFISKEFMGLQCQYSKAFPPFVCQFQLATFQSCVTRFLKYFSSGVSPLKYSLAHKNPINK